jgi:hypothetical protein
MDRLTCFSCSSARRLLSASASKLAANKPLTAAVSMIGSLSGRIRRLEGCFVKLALGRDR